MKVAPFLGHFIRKMAIFVNVPLLVTRRPVQPVSSGPKCIRNVQNSHKVARGTGFRVPGMAHSWKKAPKHSTFMKVAILLTKNP